MSREASLHWFLTVAMIACSAQTSGDLDIVEDIAPDQLGGEVIWSVPIDFMGMCPLDADPKEEHWEQMTKWGVKVVRQGFFWEWMTRPDGTFDFTWPDRYMDAALHRGIKVLVVLDYDHAALHGQDDARPFIPPDKIEMWLSYVRAVAKRYDGDAFGFEIWNEPNQPQFWKGSVDDFATLVEATIPVIREVAPNTPIAVAGFSLFPLDWLEALDARGIMSSVDALSFHPYWVDAEGALEMVAMAKEWLSSRGLSLELWLTEYGWPTGGSYPTATDLEGQAQRLVRFLSGAAAIGVRATWWYTSLDFKDPNDVENPDDSEGFFGLAWPTAGDKPAAQAFEILASMLPLATLDSEVSKSVGVSPLEVRGFRTVNGTPFAVVWNPTTTPITPTLPPGWRCLWPSGLCTTANTFIVSRNW